MPELVNDASKQIWEQDLRHNLHPFTEFPSFNENGALIIESGEGNNIKDSNGQTYLDAIGGLWCTNIGLGNEEMADAIAEQVKKLAYSSIFTDMSNEPAALLSAKIASLAPGDLNRVHFATGGSTAVDSAFRLVHYYQGCQGNPEKLHVIARHQAYHGSTYAAMSLGRKKTDRTSQFHFITDIIHHISAPDQYRAPEGMNEDEYCDHLVKEFEDKIFEIGVDKVGGFIAEPIMGAGGVLVPPKGYLKRFRDICKAHDILYISDEVVTGFGRLGHWFASESVFDFVPDIITSAKGLSSGYLPISAMIYSDRVHEVISEGQGNGYFPHGFTYSGHPVCCVAALKNIEIIKRENILQNVREVGPYFGEQLQKLRDLPLVGDVRGMGLMRCVENVMNKETKECFPEEVQIGKRISDVAEELGLLVRPVGHLNIMSPGLTLTRKEVDEIVDKLGRAIERVNSELIREGWNPC